MDNSYYVKPSELPAGFWEVCQPLAAWVLKSLVDAYDNGYSAGRADGALLAAKERQQQRAATSAVDAVARHRRITH